jgi:hypothetical protein
MLNPHGMQEVSGSSPLSSTGQVFSQVSRRWNEPANECLQDLIARLSR